MPQPKKIHFVGAGGIGMSALAQMHAMSGDIVTGSDRFLDNHKGEFPLWGQLKSLGIKLFPQDGSGISSDTSAVVLSTAIEDSNSEVAKARALGIKLVHRAELLAEWVAKSKTVAVSGTSGKSTVTAMVYEILSVAGMAPSVITGAPLISLQKQGLAGNAFRGKSDILVIEADESDGSLVNYKPQVGLLLNLTKDHKELDVLFGYFRTFKNNCRNFIVNSDEKNLSEFLPGSFTFGFSSGELRAENVNLDAFSSSFIISGTKFVLPHTGKYNVENALAACAAAVKMGVPLEKCAQALAKFSGVARRFNSIGSDRGVEVVDDFAHNPAKVSAALSAARLRGRRVLAVFQPHGFAPLRLMRQEFAEAFSSSVRPGDILWLPDVYYAGGTVTKTVTSEDVVADIKALGADARFLANRDDVAAEIARAAQPGDVVIVMGARDPTLSSYSYSVLKLLQQRP